MKYYIYLLTCIISFYVVLGDKSAQEYLSEGSHFLTSGKLNDALIRFDAAIRIEPTNYLSYFKRATAYLSLGRNNAAIDDFTKILNLKPDFDKALLQRARIYITEGKFDLAIQDLSNYLKNNSHDLEAEQWLNIATSSLQYLKQAEDAQKKGNYDECISQATLVSRQSPSLASVRSLRAQCHIAKGEIVETAGDLARVAQLNPSDFTTFILLTKMNYFALYEPQLALTHIKQCLHYDPEQKQCKQLFKSIKKLDKTITDIENDIESKRFTTAANKLIGTANREGILQQIDLDVDSLEKELGSKIPRKLHSKCYQLACQLYGEQKEKNEDKIHSWCSKALTLDENNKDALIYRGEILLHRKEYDAAVRDLEKANELSEGRDQRVRQLLAQAQQKLKLSKKRDYYKILDVSPTADSREIKKAYRKKAHEWHPDKYSGEMEKEQVESKMAEINQAYEVLSDPDKRQQYDNGFDPYDPEQGQQAPGGGPGGAGNPMGGFPFHFQQGGFQFQNGFPFGGGSFSGRGQQGNRFRGFQQQGGFPGGGFNMHF